MPYSTALKNALLNTLRNVSYAEAAVWVSLHTADPGDTGANEVSGGSYARIAVTFNAAAAGSMDSSSTPVINVPAGTTITHLGLWDAETVGNWLGSSDITDEVFGGAGTYTVDDLDLDLNA